MESKTAKVVLVLVITAAAWLVSCVDVPTNGPPVPDFVAEFRFINAAEDLGDVGVNVDGESVGTAAYGSEIARRTFPAGSRVVSLNSGDSQTIGMATDRRGSVIILPLVGATRQFLNLNEGSRFAPTTRDTATVNAVIAADVPSILIRFSDIDDEDTFLAINFQEQSGSRGLPVGQHMFRVDSGLTGDTLLEVPINISSNRPYTLVLMGSSDGTGPGTLTAVLFES